MDTFKLQLDELVESNEYVQTREAVDDLVYSIACICDPDDSDEYPITDIVKGVKDFLSMIPRDNMKKSMDHLLIFQFWRGSRSLVSLFESPIKGNKEIGEESIRLFLINPKLKTGFLPKSILNQCALVILQFCDLLKGSATDDDQCLYNSCRETLVYILTSIDRANRSTYSGFTNATLLIELIFPLISELSGKLFLSLSTLSDCSRDIHEFALFSLYMRKAIEEHVRSKGQSLPLCVQKNFDQEHPLHLYQIQGFYREFHLLLLEVKLCLCELKIYPHGGAKGLPKFNPMWSNYLTLLKELNDISKLYQGADNEYSAALERFWFSIYYLVINSNRIDEHQWIREHNNEKVNESRRRSMMMMMFTEMKPDNEKPHIMLIDRSQILTESFEDIANTNPKSLHNGLSVMFKNEGASGSGVLREWFFLVCQALFDPENSLFLACPGDRRRFFPNPAKVDPQRLKYFGFCGRAIALALMLKLQIGIAFDRVFFLQLAGKRVSLEDVRYADPFMYKSCKKILEMDADFVDSDAMGLTFVREIEEFGSRKVVELHPGGSTIVVNSKNRKEYVNLLIQHCFVKSISTKVAYFARGFGDILSKRKFQKIFFQYFELEDLDCLLLGSDKPICVKDWKAHTDYEETDEQICWFWKVVEGLSVEQQRALLFFWTSVKYLPVNGFAGLSSRLHIYKTKDSHYHLPSSQTCFLHLRLPQYPSLDIMQQRLYLICQEHVGCSFGLS